MESMQAPTQHAARDPCAGGFSFDNVARNASLEQRLGLRPPGTLKTGTTIVGVVARGCVVLGADTRATEGPLVADKNCKKLHYIAPNIWCAGAGTSADLDHTTDLMASKITLHRLNTGRDARVETVLRMLRQHLFKYQGQIGAYILLGGVDFKGDASLHMIHAHGSSAELPYATMGSGSLAAMAVLESRFRDGLEEAQAVELVRDAVAAGVLNDMGSGGNVDVVVVRPPGQQSELRRGIFRPAGARQFRATELLASAMVPGTTPVLKQATRPLPPLLTHAVVLTAPPPEIAAMDV
eukprot:m51a1_g11143 putative proteasome subunit beta type 7 (295) ;mRNA; r:205599-206703